MTLKSKHKRSKRRSERNVKCISAQEKKNMHFSTEINQRNRAMQQGIFGEYMNDLLEVLEYL